MTPFQIGAPRMSEPEVALFLQTLQGSRAYLEFGMGGSSLLAVRAGIAAVVMVDSDPAWVGSVRQHPEIAAGMAAGRVSVLHADIGPVRDWGNPVDRSTLERWHAYMAVAWNEWVRRHASPDLVFIDGRFRMACCYSVVLATGAGSFTPAPRVMVHDFNAERPQYREALEFYSIETQAESLVVLRMRRDASPAAALVRLLTRQFDYG